MKKWIAVLLAVAMVLSLAACGGGEEDGSHIGAYHGVVANTSGTPLKMSEIYSKETRLDLEAGGKGSLKLDGIDFPVKWKLKEDTLTLTIQGSKSTGTLKDGVIVIEPLDSGIEMTFLKEGAELPPTYHDAGYREAVRIDSDNRNLLVLEENIYSASTLRYLDMNPDGTGTLFLGSLLPITWRDSTVVWHDGTFSWCEGTVTLTGDGTTYPYTLKNGELTLDMTDRVLVFRAGEKPQTMDPSKELTGFDVVTGVGVIYPYTTGTYFKENLATTAEATVTRYEVFDSSEDYPAKEGYEWRVVEMEVHFCDTNSNSYGASIEPIFEDYYNSKLCDDGAEILEQTDAYTLQRYPIVYNGQQMDAYLYSPPVRYGDWYWVPETGLVEVMGYLQWNFQVPKGYDGCIAGLMDARLEWADGTYITDYNPDDFLLFRAY